MNKYELTPMLETIGHSRLELRENIAAVRLELIENSLSQVTHSALPLRLCNRLSRRKCALIQSLG